MKVVGDCLCEIPLSPLFASDSDFKARMGACKIGLPQVLVELVESCSMVLEQLGEKEAKRKSNVIMGGSRS